MSPCDFNLLLDFDHMRTEPDLPLRERAENQPTMEMRPKRVRCSIYFYTSATP